MQVNTDFYGLPETWIKNTSIENNNNTPREYWFKMADVNPNDSTANNRQSRLIDYVDDNKIEFGEPIDYSICYAAMSGGTLCNQVAYALVGDGVGSPAIVERNLNTGADPVGWFLGYAAHGYSAPANYIYSGAALMGIDGYYTSQTTLSYYWRIGDTAGTFDNINNTSQGIQPIVEFNPRGCYMAIMVTIFDKQTGNFNNYTLDDVRTNYANNTFTVERHVIVRAYGDLYVRTGATESYTLQRSSRFGVCANMPLCFDENDSENTYINYANCLYNNFILLGWLQGNPSKRKWEARDGERELLDNMYYPYMRPFYESPKSSDFGADSTAYIWVDATTMKYKKFAKSADYGEVVINYVELSEEVFEDIRQAAAYYGLFFTEKSGSSFSSNPDKWTDDNMFCGVLRDGVGYGDYTRGHDNRNNPIYNMESSQESEYNPDEQRKYHIYVGNNRVRDIYIGDKYVNTAYLGDYEL